MITKLERALKERYNREHNITGKAAEISFQFCELGQYWNQLAGNKQDPYHTEEIKLMKQMTEADPRFIFSLFTANSDRKLMIAIQTFKKENNLKTYRFGHVNLMTKITVAHGDLLAFEYYSKCCPVLFMKKEVEEK